MFFLLRFSHVFFCIVVMRNDVKISLFFHIFVLHVSPNRPSMSHGFVPMFQPFVQPPKYIYIFKYLSLSHITHMTSHVFGYACLTASRRHVTKEWWFTGRIILLMWPSFGWMRQTQKQTIPKITMLGKLFPRSQVVSFMVLGFPH